MRFFTADNPVFNFISRIGDMLLLSILWFVTSLPVITIGASTTALYYCCIKIIRSRDSSILKDYFRAFAENFKQSTLIFLIMAAIGALGGFDMYFWAHSESEIATFMNAVSIGIMIIYAAVLLYVFPVQAVFENTLKATVKNAFLMSLKHWKTTLGLLAGAAAVSFLCWKFIVVGYFFLLIGTGIFGMLYSLQFVNVFKNYSDVIADDMRGKDWDRDRIEEDISEADSKPKVIR